MRAGEEMSHTNTKSKKWISDMLFKRTTIAPQERGLRYVNGALTEILAPGVYWTS